MNAPHDTYTLSCGITVPCLALGTRLIESDAAADCVRHALACGMRHITASSDYDNEAGIGEGIARSRTARSEIFVTVRLPADTRAERVITEVEASIARLSLDCINLVLVRPNDTDMCDTWRALESLARDGRVRAIGTADFTPDGLEAIMNTASVKPTETLDYCKAHGIIVMARSPLGHGASLNLPAVREIADKYGVSPARLCVRFALQLDCIPMPCSAMPERILENADVFEFTISAEDMRSLASAAPAHDKLGENDDV